jgi:hypothetical protein
MSDSIELADGEHVPIQDTVCECGHWYKEHDGIECAAPGCVCAGFIWVPTSPSSPTRAIADPDASTDRRGAVVTARFDWRDADDYTLVAHPDHGSPSAQALFGILDEDAGGYIAFTTGEQHARAIVDALNHRAAWAARQGGLFESEQEIALVRSLVRRRLANRASGAADAAVLGRLLTRLEAL